MQHFGKAPLLGRPLTIPQRADRESVVDRAVQELQREAVRHIAGQRMRERERAFKKPAYAEALACIEKIEREVLAARARNDAPESLVEPGRTSGGTSEAAR